MIRASDLKRGQIVKIDTTPHIVEDVVVQSPSARGGATLYKVRFRNVRSKQKVDQTLRGEDVLPEADFERRDIQFLYEDPAGCTFMDLEDYSQFTLPREELENERLYMTDGLEGIRSLVSDGRILGIELPPTVELEVAETDPVMRGATAASRNKPAKLSTGLVVKVPEYIGRGDVLRVDTRTGEFLSRA